MRIVVTQAASIEPRIVAKSAPSHVLGLGSALEGCDMHYLTLIVRDEPTHTDTAKALS